MPEIGEEPIYRVKLESQKDHTYVSLGSDGVLIAGQNLEEGEIFRIIHLPEKNRYAILPETSKFKFVSMAHDGSTLKAEAGWILEYEVFELKLDKTSNLYGLKATKNDKYVSVREDSVLRAVGPKLDLWEKFDFHSV